MISNRTTLWVSIQTHTHQGINEDYFGQLCLLVKCLSGFILLREGEDEGGDGREGAGDGEEYGGIGREIGIARRNLLLLHVNHIVLL